MMLTEFKRSGKFDKVVQMMDNLMASFEKGQVDDDKKKEWCDDVIHTVEQIWACFRIHNAG